MKGYGRLYRRDSVELNLAGISTLEEANNFLATFVQQYNRKFAREPRDPQSAFFSGGKCKLRFYTLPKGNSESR